MTSPPAVEKKGVYPHADDFSLVLGGPLYQLLSKAHLTGNALEHWRSRIILITLFAWLPLAFLTLIEGHFQHVQDGTSFVQSVEVHVRLLLALPLLIVAEVVMHQRLISIVKQFDERNLIPEPAQARFASAITSAFRLRNSVVAEVLLLVFVYGVGVFYIWRKYIAIYEPTWYAVPAETGMRLSLAGWWYMFVSVPVFQFLLMRWYFRIFIWARFMWQVSRIELSLVPTHPDRLGGVGFLANTCFAFVPLLAAHGAMLAGPIAERIFYFGAKLTDFKMGIAALVVFLLVIVGGPLLFFAPQLALAKRKGSRVYGVLAERYVREFDAKWIGEGGGKKEGLMGSADIQSLADLSGSYDVIRSMRMIPLTWEALVKLIVATLLPLAPLLLTLISMDELLNRVVGILF